MSEAVDDHLPLLHRKIGDALLRAEARRGAKKAELPELDVGALVESVFKRTSVVSGKQLAPGDLSLVRIRADEPFCPRTNAALVSRSECMSVGKLGLPDDAVARARELLGAFWRASESKEARLQRLFAQMPPELQRMRHEAMERRAAAEAEAAAAEAKRPPAEVDVPVQFSASLEAGVRSGRVKMLRINGVVRHSRARRRKISMTMR